MQRRSRSERHLPTPDVFPRPANIISWRDGDTDLDAIASRTGRSSRTGHVARILELDDGVGARRDGCAGHDARGRSARYRFTRLLAGGDKLRDSEANRRGLRGVVCIGGDDGIAVHRRIRKGRQIDGADDILRQHAPIGVIQCHRFAHKRSDALHDGAQRLVN